jgi:SAM-dependent methyltransferase
LDQILEALKDHKIIRDRDFDKLFPKRYQEISETHWTPVEIARRAAQLLVVDSTTRVLDVGSGIGKFCFIGALTTPGQFVGVEQRPHLVKLAHQLVTDFQIPKVLFLEGDARGVDWSQFQSFYLYNPFVENIYSCNVRIDQTVEFGKTRYQELVRWVQKRLHLLPVGTRVATYHGFGGDMPPGYELIVEVPGDGDFLQLWIKTSNPI